MNYQILDWDSNFFEINIAKITSPILEREALSEILSELKDNGIKLVYWPSAIEVSSNIITPLGGILADTKTTFTTHFTPSDYKQRISDINIEPFHDSMSIDSIERLAIQSGEYSRFAVDPKFPREKFISLYKSWAKRSLDKSIASEVLVIREGEKTVGFVTLGEKNNRGDIGLIAIDSAFRGRKYGEKLVSASQRWFAYNGFKSGQVVTQGNNLPACNLYKKCGYEINRIEYFYHFWLQ